MSSITATPQYVENIDRDYGESWTDPDNIKVSDDTYTTVFAGQSDWLKMQDFDFSTLPDTAKIVGVEFAIHCKGLHVKDAHTYLAYEGIVGGSDRAGCEEWKNNENIHILGNSNDTWGWNLVPSLVKSQWFGVNFCAKHYDSDGGTASIDYVTLTIYYENQANIIQICNDALALIGEPPITDIDGTDNRSRACKTSYYSVHERLLGSHNWYFASIRAQLRPSYDCSCFGWNYVFVLPSNFLRMVDTYPVGISYELGAENKIYMNEGGGCIKYIANIQDPALFDIHFKTALIYCLALILQPGLVDKITAYQVLQREANNIISKTILAGTRHQKNIKGTFDWTSEMRI